MKRRLGNRVTMEDMQDIENYLDRNFDDYFVDAEDEDEDEDEEEEE